MQSSSVLPISFDQLIAGYSTWKDSKEIPDFLQQCNGQNIVIKGFLYKESGGHWILSSEPNLKSCCIGSQQKINSQIAIFGDLPLTAPTRAISLQGNLQIASPSSNYFYSLSQASVVIQPSANGHYWMESGIAVFLCLILFLFYGRAWYYRTRHSNF